MRGNGNKAFLKAMAVTIVGGLVVNWIAEKMRNRNKGA